MMMMMTTMNNMKMKKKTVWMSDTVVLKLTKAGGNDELDRQAWSQQAAKQLQARHTSAVERSKMNGCSLLVLWTDPIGDQPINGKRPVCMFVLWFFCCLLLCFIPPKLVQLGPLWPNSPWRSCRLHESNGFQFCYPRQYEVPMENSSTISRRSPKRLRRCGELLIEVQRLE